MNKQVLVAAAATVLAMGVAQGVSAQENTTEVAVTYEITAINRIDFSGNPALLSINNAAKLNGDVAVSDVSTTWGITTNEVGMRVQASVSGLADDVTLNVFMAAPAGANSSAQDLVGTVDLVTDISELTASGLGVTYTLSALPTAGPVAGGSATVTYTIVAGL